MRWRARAALTGVAGAAAVGLTPVPASACSCWTPTVAESRAAGQAVAIVTPTDCVLDELRLAGSEHVAGLPGRGGEASGDEADEELEEPSTALLVGITLSASTMAGAAALAGLMIRRRRAD